MMLVFAMAAIVSIMLYMELPRVAFEAVRAKEQTLIDRGEQYSRAIKLYMRKFPGKYPASIDQLENTNNIRFLRRRYKDPMTGNEDWRIIHAGPGGVLTDSLVQKPPQTKKDGSFGSDIGTPIGANADSVPVTSNKPPPRPSQTGNMSNMPGGMQPWQMNPADPVQQDQATAQYPGVVQPGQPVQFQPGQPVPFGQAGQPGQPYPNTQPGTPPGQPSYGVPGQPGFAPGMVGPPGSLPGINPSIQNPYGQPPPVPLINPNDQNQPGTGTGANSAVDMINSQLRNQRSSQPSFGFGSQTIGGGIAGVASKFEAQGIKVYNERTKYQEWEFVYDPRKDMGNPMMPGQQPGLPNQPGLQGPQPNRSPGPH